MSVLDLAQWCTAVVVTGVLLWYVWDGWQRRRSRVRQPKGTSLERQSVELAGEPGVFASPLASGRPLEQHDERVKTLYDAFMRGMDESGNGECLGTRADEHSAYEWLHYVDVFSQAIGFGAGLLQLGLRPGAKSFVAIYSRNCPQWFIVALGCISQSMVIVPLYDTLGAEAAEFILRQTGASVVVVDSGDKAARLAALGRAPKHMVVTVRSQTDAALTKQCAAAGVQLHVMEDLIGRGRQQRSEAHPPRPDDLYIICYTSGTTGEPKGVMLSHRNMVANVSVICELERLYGITMVAAGDAAISYLPLSHMFEQMVHWLCIYKGAKVGYFRGDILSLAADMKALRPAFFPVVPRLLNRLYDQVNATIAKASPITRWLFRTAYDAKLAELGDGIVRRNSFWDWLVFRKIQRQFGGRVSFVVTGSAPIAPECLEFCRVLLGCHIFEGYGQTECTALATHSLPADVRGGHVGSPALCAHVKLVDAPALECWARDGVGEVCVRGPSVSAGYFKDAERTAETIDADGWLHTGDVGRWTADGTLRIVDRVKHMFKLAQGEYVAPEKIENVYVRAPSVAQVFVDGDSLRRHLVGVVVPHADALAAWFRRAHPDRPVAPTLDELCRMADARAHVLHEMTSLAKESGLNSLEQVKAIELVSDAFSVENGLLTPTLKAKRPQLRKRFADTIRKLYD